MRHAGVIVQLDVAIWTRCVLRGRFTGWKHLLAEFGSVGCELHGALVLRGPAVRWAERTFRASTEVGGEIFEVSMPDRFVGRRLGWCRHGPSEQENEEQTAWKTFHSDRENVHPQCTLTSIATTYQWRQTKFLAEGALDGKIEYLGEPGGRRPC